MLLQTGAWMPGFLTFVFFLATILRAAAQVAEYPGSTGDPCQYGPLLLTVKCHSGYFCGSRNYNVINAYKGACTECPSNYYCTDGLNKVQCITGYVSLPGSTACTPASDANCPFPCYGILAWGRGNCTCDHCPGGQYAESWSSVGKTCKLCPPGKYSTFTDSTHSGYRECLPCDAGKYSHLEGMVECIQCDYGKNQPSMGQTSCVPCDQGYQAYVPGMANCEACGPGKFASFPGQPSCDTCPTGTYSSLTFGSTDCTVCPAGKFSTIEGSSTDLVCESCAVGKVSSEWGDACVACPNGWSTKSPGQAKCTACDSCPDQYTKNTTNCYINVMTECEPASCAPCPSGYYIRPDTLCDVLNNIYFKPICIKCRTCGQGYVPSMQCSGKTSEDTVVCVSETTYYNNMGVRCQGGYHADQLIPAHLVGNLDNYNENQDFYYRTELLAFNPANPNIYFRYNEFQDHDPSRRQSSAAIWSVSPKTVLHQFTANDKWHLATWSWDGGSLIYWKGQIPMPWDNPFQPSTFYKFTLATKNTITFYYFQNMYKGSLGTGEYYVPAYFEHVKEDVPCVTLPRPAAGNVVCAANGLYQVISAELYPRYPAEFYSRFLSREQGQSAGLLYDPFRHVLYWTLWKSAEQSHDVYMVDIPHGGYTIGYDIEPQKIQAPPIAGSSDGSASLVGGLDFRGAGIDPVSGLIFFYQKTNLSYFGGSADFGPAGLPILYKWNISDASAELEPVHPLPQQGRPFPEFVFSGITGPRKFLTWMFSQYFLDVSASGALSFSRYTDKRWDLEPEYLKVLFALDGRMWIHVKNYQRTYSDNIDTILTAAPACKACAVGKNRSTSDPVIGCKCSSSAAYASNYNGTCSARRTSCDPGYYLVEDGNTFEDMQCAKCPDCSDGEYIYVSPLSPSTCRCKPCTTCGTHYYISGTESPGIRYCTGKGLQDRPPTACVPCLATCGELNYRPQVCSGTSSTDTTVCSSCTPCPENQYISDFESCTGTQRSGSITCTDCVCPDNKFPNRTGGSYCTGR